MTLADLVAAPPTICTDADITLGQLILQAYAQGFAETPSAVDLSALGFVFEDTWMSHGPCEPPVAYGIVASHPDLGCHLAIRGTDDWQEWVQDAEFWPETCPFGPKGAKTEAGFTSLVLGGFLASGRPASALLHGGELALDGVEGHSLGAAIAEGIAAKLSLSYAGLWACPRLGNEIFRNALLGRVRRVWRPYMVGDVVPGLPLDLEPFFEYLHPPGFQIDNPRAQNNPDARHQLATYLNALSPNLPLDPGSVAIGPG